MKGGIYPTKYGYHVRYGRAITLHFKTLPEAERCLTGLRWQDDQGILDPRDFKKGNPMGFDRLAKKWLDFKEGKIKPTSFAPLRNYMNQAITEWGGRNIKTIDYPEIEDFLYRRDEISEKTRHNMMSCLKQFFKWLNKRKIIHEMPEIPDVPFELGWRNIIDIPTQRKIIDEVWRISHAVNPKIHLGISWLSLYTDVRPGELINLKERQIDLKLGAIVIPHPKEKKPKVVLLDADDIETVQALPRGLPDMYFFRHPKGISGIKAGTKFGVHYLWKWWKKACANLEVEEVDLYGGTRHSTVTALGQICTPEEVRDRTGHASKAFERYFQGRASRALRVLKKFKEQTEPAEVVPIVDAKLPID
jgi:integrase